jgi:uncharacterized protein YbbC (DUF1343 family)
MMNSGTVTQGSRPGISISALRLALFALTVAVFCNPAITQPVVSTGADLLVSKHLGLLKGKKVGMIINHTSRLQSGVFLLDTLQKSGIVVTALFGPEHGIRGVAAAGEHLSDSVDSVSGVQVFSLYGKHSKPTAEMLRNVDILLYDIQDVGARFYTYISTLKLCMDAAAEHGIPFVVLDRPNPLGGQVDGPLLEDSLRSFVGIGPIPVVYGMTCGELASFMNGTGWLSEGRKADLKVIWLEGWNTKMDWSATGLPWVAPSPNIPTPESAIAYPATCFIEATNVSEGRGSNAPFEQFGAPFINSDDLVQALKKKHIPGVAFAPAQFTPVSSKHAGTLCNGVRMTVTNRSLFRPVYTGLTLISVLLRENPDSVRLNHAWLGKLLGMGSAAVFLERGDDPVSLEFQWEKGIAVFVMKSRGYLHYSAR